MLFRWAHVQGHWSPPCTITATSGGDSPEDQQPRLPPVCDPPLPVVRSGPRTREEVVGREQRMAAEIATRRRACGVDVAADATGRTAIPGCGRSGNAHARRWRGGEAPRVPRRHSGEAGTLPGSRPNIYKPSSADFAGDGIASHSQQFHNARIVAKANAEIVGSVSKGTTRM